MLYHVYIYMYRACRARRQQHIDTTPLLLVLELHTRTCIHVPSQLAAKGILLGVKVVFSYCIKRNVYFIS